jgi:formylglycine-generating enzyme required for sulfatase activity
VPSAFARVETALQFDRTAEATTPADHAEAWRLLLARIAAPDAPHYGGRVIPLEPQADLMPLGRDPQSQLEEFAYVRSGIVQARAADGSIPRTDDMPIVFVLLPGGKIQVGTNILSHPSVGMSIGTYERLIAPFFCSKFEVTQYQWATLGGGNPSCFQDDGVLGLGIAAPARHPVESSTWIETQRVLGRHGMELPTEFQWEYAARGDVIEDHWWIGTVLAPGEQCENWTVSRGDVNVLEMPPFSDRPGDDGFLVHAPVGSLKANPFGFQDVLGNVAEMCRDNFGFNVLEQPRDGDGLRLSTMFALKTVRGGCFAAHGGLWHRIPAPANMRSPLVGIRPVRKLNHG